jgi:hypothetical protein
MIKKIFLTLLILVVCISLFSQTKPNTSRNRIGMLCNFELVKPIINYSDSVISGCGIKYWLLDVLPLRALVFVNILSNSTTNETISDYGFSLAAEYHFISGPVSPYVGAFAGAEILSDTLAQTGVDYHLGGLFGAEIDTPLNYLSFFVEYSLYVIFQEQGTKVDLGKDHLPTLGVIIYFN